MSTIRFRLKLFETNGESILFFFYSLFYVDTNFLFINLQIVLWILIHTLSGQLGMKMNVILMSMILTKIKKHFEFVQIPSFVALVSEDNKWASVYFGS